MIDWPRAVASILFGALVALLARLALRIVLDAATYADRFNTGLFVLGTLLVTVVVVAASSASTAAALGAALTSIATIVASWMGLRFAGGEPSGDVLGRLIAELGAAFDLGYLDAGAIILAGAFIAVAAVRLRTTRGGTRTPH